MLDELLYSINWGSKLFFIDVSYSNKMILNFILKFEYLIAGTVFS